MALSEEAKARRTRPPHLPDLHAFLARYGHKTPHQDKHVLKAIGDAKTHAQAVRRLAEHPAFFVKGTAVAPGEHRFTGKPATPRKRIIRAPVAETAKAAAPSHVGDHAAGKHLHQAEEFAKRAEKALRMSNPLPEHPRFTRNEVKLAAHNAHQERERDIARVATMYSASAQAHHDSSRAARMHSASAHEKAAQAHTQAAKHQALYGDLKTADAHKEHAAAHTKAAAAVRALQAKPASAAAKKVAWLKKATSFTLSKASGAGVKAAAPAPAAKGKGAALVSWRGAGSGGGKSARKSGWAAWKAKKLAAGVKV